MASATEQASAQAAHTIGGCYRITGLIGTGLIAEVSRAVDTGSGAEVALKVFAPAALARSEIRERVVRAIQSLASIQHPQILSALRAEHDEVQVWYPMPWARGGSLEARVRLRTQVPTDRVVGIVKEVAAALDHLHEHGLVHGGLKPSNILFDEDGHALLADAGIERAAFPPRSIYPPEARHAQAYHAPELRYQRNIDGRADQYALAVITYELLTGQRRLDGHVIEGIQTVDPLEVPIEQPLRRDAGLHVNAALRKALSANPNARFGSAGAFAQAVAGDGDSATTPGKARRRAPLQAKRYIVPLAIAALAAGCVLLLRGSGGKERVARAWQAARGLFGTTLPRIRGDVASGSVTLQAPPPRSPDFRPPSNFGVTALGGTGASGGRGGHDHVGTPDNPGSNTGRGLRDDGQGTTGGSTVLGQLVKRSSSAPDAPVTNRRSASTGTTTTELPATSASSGAPAPSLISRLGRFFGFSGGSGDADGSGPASRRMDRSPVTVVPIPVPSASVLTPSSDTSAGHSGLGVGYVKVTVDDGSALAIVDGIPRGPTPVVIGLGAGSHTVSARSLDGSYLPARIVVSIGDADTALASFHKAAASTP